MKSQSIDYRDEQGKGKLEVEKKTYLPTIEGRERDHIFRFSMSKHF